MDATTKVDVSFSYLATEDTKEVKLTGSFSKWDASSLFMTKDPNSPNFRISVPLLVGIHHYKFIVDGVWTVSSNDPVMIDLCGNENNCISVRTPAPLTPHKIPKEWDGETNHRHFNPKKKNALFRNQLMLPGVHQISMRSSSESLMIHPTSGGGNQSQKLLIITVGLPARGKSFITQKLGRYLYWLGFPSKVLSSSAYRTKMFGKFFNHGWYDPDNSEGTKSRNKVTRAALEDAFTWFRKEDGIVALFDGDHCTKDNRDRILRLVKDQKPDLRIRTIFLEIISTDPEVIESNIQSTISLPEYEELDRQCVRDDIVHRIQHLRASYEPINDKNHYIQVFNGGDQLVMNRVTGFLPSKIMFYLSNMRTVKKNIYFVRHGESEYNARKLIGGDPCLTSRGTKFATMLSQWVKENIPENTKKLSVWSSTMMRAIETAENIECFQYIQWKVLGEIEAGICDSMSYQDIAEKYPEEYEARQADKLRYRYPRGESYEDLIRRVEPVIIELERIDKPVMVVAHQAVLRCIYAYFSRNNYTRSQVPHINFPSHCVVRVTPQVYGAEEERFYFDVDDEKSE